jgi:membrane protein
MLSELFTDCYTLHSMRRKTTFIIDLYRECRNDSLLRHSAAVAYYAVFSLPALMLVVFSIVRTALHSPSVEADILAPIRLYMGEGTALLLQEAAIALQEQKVTGEWPAIVGVLLLVLAAIGLIRELQGSLNTIFGLPPDTSTLLHTLVLYLKAMIPLILIGVILIASLTASTVLGIAEQHLLSAFDLPVDLLQIGSYIITLFALTAIFAVLYSVLPSKRYPFRLVISCAFFAAAGLFFGSIIVSKVAIFSSIGSIYGVAANLMVLMFWMFFCGNAFFIGAECVDLLSRKKIV